MMLLEHYFSSQKILHLIDKKKKTIHPLTLHKEKSVKTLEMDVI
jgi:hypothetical protein